MWIYFSLNDTAVDIVPEIHVALVVHKLIHATRWRHIEIDHWHYDMSLSCMCLPDVSLLYYLQQLSVSPFWHTCMCSFTLWYIFPSLSLFLPIQKSYFVCVRARVFIRVYVSALLFCLFCCRLLLPFYCTVDVPTRCKFTEIGFLSESVLMWALTSYTQHPPPPPPFTHTHRVTDLAANKKLIK